MPLADLADLADLTDLRKRYKAQTEYFYLLDVSDTSDSDSVAVEAVEAIESVEAVESVESVESIVCVIQNDHDKEYTITIRNYTDAEEIKIACTCPDFIYRQKICKHIYWLGHSKIGHLDPYEWTHDMIMQFCRLYKDSVNPIIGRNDICPICIENIDYTTEKTICCVHSCWNSTHSKCWIRYYLASQNTRCVLCRHKY
jgi:hypothetical protein